MAPRPTQKASDMQIVWRSSMEVPIYAFTSHCSHILWATCKNRIQNSDICFFLTLEKIMSFSLTLPLETNSSTKIEETYLVFHEWSIQGGFFVALFLFFFNWECFGILINKKILSLQNIKQEHLPVCFLILLQSD